MQCLFVIGCTKIEIEEYRSTYSMSEPSSLMVAEPSVEYKTTKDEN
jgi:hypothetical protein